MLVRTLIGAFALIAAVAAVPTSSHQSCKTYGAGTTASIQNLKSKIKNVVAMVMENRSVDNLLGGQTIPGLDNPIKSTPYCNPFNLTNPSQGQACSAASDYNSVLDDPDHSVSGNNIEFYGTFTPDNAAIQSGKLTPTMNGFAYEQYRLYHSSTNKTTLATEVMNYYTEKQVPVITALTNNFVVFNHWHSAIPGVRIHTYIHTSQHTHTHTLSLSLSLSMYICICYLIPKTSFCF
jgi:phospholipase C